MQKRIALFPGSFDPITHAHVDIILRATPLFDEIHVAIGQNSAKQTRFSLEQRLAMLTELFASSETIRVTSYEGLTVDFCKQIQANYILRGLRNTADFNYENAIAQNNLQLAQAIETVFFVSSPGLNHISSTIVRDILKNNGSIAHLVPKEVLHYI